MAKPAKLAASIISCLLVCYLIGYACMRMSGRLVHYDNILNAGIHGNSHRVTDRIAIPPSEHNMRAMFLPLCKMEEAAWSMVK